jgi:hypothetical protein
MANFKPDPDVSPDGPVAGTLIVRSRADGPIPLGKVSIGSSIGCLSLWIGNSWSLGLIEEPHKSLHARWCLQPRPGQAFDRNPATLGDLDLDPRAGSRIELEVTVAQGFYERTS